MTKTKQIELLTREFLETLEQRFEGLQLCVSVDVEGLSTMAVKAAALEDPGYYLHDPSVALPKYMSTKFCRASAERESYIDLRFKTSPVVGQKGLNVIKKAGGHHPSG